MYGPTLPPSKSPSRAPTASNDDNDDTNGSSIGPSLPPGFLKSRQQQDQEETHTHSDSHSIGPALPPQFLKSRSSVDSEDRHTEEEEENEASIGPALPPGFRKKSTVVDPPPPSEDNAIVGPALPPHLLAARNKGASTSTNLPTKAAEEPKRGRRVMGPAAPPPPGFIPKTAHEENDDDVVGPTPVPAEYQDMVEEMEFQRKLAEIEARAQGKSLNDQDNGPQVEKRGDWMLVPPEARRLDITGGEMKNRQFSKRSADVIDSSGWTALPGERRKAAEEAKKRKLEADAPRPLTPDELAVQKMVEEHNQRTRPKSLMDMHMTDYAVHRKFEDEDVSKRGFDREKDISGRRIDAKQRKNILEEAGKLDSKFSRGSSKNFL
ncbi:hypothetical protein HDV05_007974 [Chytridiales sp. JEL 0842]|nr:hypothetical protein HDV05_007974 [Chytridiales sp. JEL 0842]